jgi:hypothetical protein
MATENPAVPPTSPEVPQHSNPSDPGQKRTPPLGLPVPAWVSCITLCGIASNFLHDAILEPAILAAYFGIGVTLTFFFWFRNDADQRSWLIVALQGLFLGFALGFCSLFAWLIAEIASRGRTTEIVLWPARMALAFFYAAIMLMLLTARKRLLLTLTQYAILTCFGIALAVLLVYSLGIAGPEDTTVYPPREQSPYRLPWKVGMTFTCTQGNLSALSHDGWQEYAYDFVMPVGTPVCAAREGQVVSVVDEHDGNGLMSPGNFIDILHRDGTIAEYVHIRQGGSRVAVGDRVEQGDLIAESGNVGYSLQAHLHFHVVKMSWSGSVQNRRTIPVSFSDVPGDGIPRTLRRYRSTPRIAD